MVENGNSSYYDLENNTLSASRRSVDIQDLPFPHDLNHSNLRIRLPRAGGG